MKESKNVEEIVRKKSSNFDDWTIEEINELKIIATGNPEKFLNYLNSFPNEIMDPSKLVSHDKLPGLTDEIKFYGKKLSFSFYEYLVGINALNFLQFYLNKKHLLDVDELPSLYLYESNSTLYEELLNLWEIKKEIFFPKRIGIMDFPFMNCNYNSLNLFIKIFAFNPNIYANNYFVRRAIYHILIGCISRMALSCIWADEKIIPIKEVQESIIFSINMIHSFLNIITCNFQIPQNSEGPLILFGWIELTKEQLIDLVNNAINSSSFCMQKISPYCAQMNIDIQKRLLYTITPLIIPSNLYFERLSMLTTVPYECLKTLITNTLYSCFNYNNPDETNITMIDGFLPFRFALLIHDLTVKFQQMHLNINQNELKQFFEETLTNTLKDRITRLTWSLISILVMPSRFKIKEFQEIYIRIRNLYMYNLQIPQELFEISNQ